MPHLSTEPDPVTGAPVPRLQLLEFRGGAGNGGFLTFQVDVGFPPEKLDALRSELRRIHRLATTPSCPRCCWRGAASSW